MAKIGFPFGIALKQKVLYTQPLPPNHLAELGDKYAQKGMWHDALEFYEGAKDQGRIRQAAEEGVRSADIVLFLNAKRALGEAAGAEQLSLLKQNALSAGKEATAKRVDTLMVPVG